MYLSNVTRSKRHFSFIMPITDPKCYKVMKVNYADKCDFIHKTADCGNNIYNKFLFCRMAPKNDLEMTVCMILLFIFIVYIFLLLAKASEFYFCPALKAVARLLRINEQIAGVTLLALGDGCADLVSLFKSVYAESSIGIEFTSIVGGCFFVSCFVSGLIIVVCPFKLSTSAFLRDSLFLLLTLLLVDNFIESGEITMYKAAGILTVYIVYLMVLIIEQVLMHYTRKKLRKQMRDTLERPNLDIHRQMSSVIYLRRSLHPLDRDLEFRYSKNDSDENLVEAEKDEMLEKAEVLLEKHVQERLRTNISSTDETDDDLKGKVPYSETTKPLDDTTTTTSTLNETIFIDTDANIFESSVNVPQETDTLDKDDAVFESSLNVLENTNKETDASLNILENSPPETEILENIDEEIEEDSVYESAPDRSSSTDFKSCEDNQDIYSQPLKSESKIGDSKTSEIDSEIEIINVKAEDFYSETAFKDLKITESSTEDLPASNETASESEIVDEPDEHPRPRASKKRFSSIFDADSRYEYRQAVLSLWIQFLNSLVQVNWKEFKFLKWFCKIYVIITIPINIVLALVIPKVDLDAPMNGWSKLLNCIHFITLPSVFISLFNLYHIQVMHGVSLIFCCIPWFAVIALLVYITSRPDEPPTYHKVFYLLAILGAIFVICIAVKNVMDIILVISYVTQLSAPFLESTFVTVGYSIGYLVSNIQFAREGYAKMAFAACFGGPMNLLALGFGTFLMMRCSAERGGKIEVSEGSLGRNSFLFMACGLFGLIIAMVVTNFVGRKSIGSFLIIIYLFGLLSFILSEHHVIHPYGTDHSLDL